MKKHLLISTLALFCWFTGIAQKAIVLPNSVATYAMAPDNAAFNLAANQSFTISAWINTTNSSSNQVFLAKRNGSGTIGYELWTSGGKFAVNCTHTNGTSSGLSAGTKVISDGKWHHVAFVLDNTNAAYYVYVDGLVDQTKGLSSTSGVSNTRNLYFGVRDGATFSLPWSGKVDEVRFYNKALSATELMTDRMTIVNASTPNLVAGWSFEEGSGTTFTDIKGLNNATITGSLIWETLNTKTPQVVTMNGPVNAYFGCADFSPATSSTAMPIEYSTSNPAIATVVNGKIHVVAKGTCTISATQSENLFYSAANSVTQTLNVLKTAITFNLPFTNHAVIQRDQPIPVSGTADPNDVLTLNLDGEIKTVNVDATGKWSCIFSSKSAKSVPFTLSAEGINSQTITLTDLLCGDVWVAAGQSNMQMNMDGIYGAVTNAAVEKANANYPNIRMIRPIDMWQQASTAQTSLTTFNGGWEVCSPTTVGGYTAVGYFFARQIYLDQNIPVGIIQGAVGGTRVEAWTPLEGLQTIPEYASWYTKATTTTLPGGQVYDRKNFPTANYNGMLAPYIKNPVKGLIWYQGEENLAIDKPSAQYEYGNKFKATIQTWRNVWNIPDMPVIFTELANYPYNANRGTGIEGFSKFIVQQRKATQLSNVYGITISDVSDFTNIHPANKIAVGTRMGNMALCYVYGKNIVAAPATFKEMRSEGTALRITFNNNTGFHMSTGTAINEFQIAGADKVFKTATATINGNDILISEPSISNPLYVKFAWDENSNPNLVNGSNTPTSRFSDSLKVNTINFKTLPDKMEIGMQDIALQATATSGIPVTFSSSNPLVATVVNDNLHIVGQGSAIITATEAGNTVYAAATAVQQTINVNVAAGLKKNNSGNIKLKYDKKEGLLTLNGLTSGDSVQIITSAGSVIRSMYAASTECRIQTGDMVKGSYLIRIHNPQKTETLKFGI